MSVAKCLIPKAKVNLVINGGHLGCNRSPLRDAVLNKLKKIMDHTNPLLLLGSSPFFAGALELLHLGGHAGCCIKITAHLEMEI